MPTLPVGDVPFHYVTSGSGPPLVLLHGLGGTWEDWEYQIPVFASQFHVIAPDLRGFGKTPRGHGPVTIARQAADVMALLRALGVQRFDLVGHSMGGAVALQLALEHPGAVRRLVIANSVPTFRPETPGQYFEVIYRCAVMLLLGPRRLARISAARQFPAPEQAGLRERFAMRAERNSRFAYLGALLSLVRWSVIERLADLSVRVLVLGSEHDFFSREETVKFAHALRYGRMQIIPGTHHGLPLESPEIFNAAVLRFLTRGET